MDKLLSQQKNGYVMLIMVITFMMISLIIIFGLATPIMKQILVSQDIWSAKQAYYLSESGVEDVLYRVKDVSYSAYVSPVETLTLNGSIATTTTSGSLGGLNGIAITSVSNQSGYEKKIEATAKQGSGVNFYYAMQSGQGGFSMSGSSGIDGNVLTTGPIYASSSDYITGSAIVSNNPNMTKDQSNESPTSPTNSITFGDTASTKDVAQSFKVSTTSPLTQLAFYIEKVGNPADLTVKIIKDVSGSPSSNANDVLTSVALPAASISTSYNWVEVAFAKNPSLATTSTYWIVLDGSTNSSSNKYVIGANIDSSYLNGTAKKGAIGSAWSTTGYDAYFRLYLGGFFGTILGQGQYNQLHIGSTASDTVWAHDVSYVSATGPIWCQNSTLNNKACIQTADPSAPQMPLSDSQTSAWEAEAAAGTVINGNYNTPTYGTETLGPAKIVGNLTVNGSNVLVVSGTLYVTGNVVITGSTVVKLASSYGTNSGVIVADGQVTIDGSAKVEGSGQSASYVLLISNSSCPTSGTCNGSPDGSNAMEIVGSGSGVILNAQKGTLEFTGSSNANEATANKIIMSGSTVINYKTGIASPNFSSGPSGGVNITGWSELSQ